MLKLTELCVPGYELVMQGIDDEAGLHGLIAIHNTNLGPALGGCRYWLYPSVSDALADVLDLSMVMTYKSALAGLPLGGGKFVILASPDNGHAQIPMKLLLAAGEFVNALKGRYITSKDLGTTMRDLRVMSMATRYIVGLESDPSKVTAHGVFRAIEVLAEEVLHKDLANTSVALMGIGGAVGKCLGELLLYAGVGRLVISERPDALAGDPDGTKRAMASVQAIRESLEKRGKAIQSRVEPIPADDIFEADVDIFSPTAKGDVINEDTIGTFRCKAIAGAANNQIGGKGKESQKLALELHRKGIFYAVDFAINCGGVIAVFEEFNDAAYSEERAIKRAVETVEKNTRLIFEESKRTDTPPDTIAYLLAEKIWKRSPLQKQELSYSGT